MHAHLRERLLEIAHVRDHLLRLCMLSLHLLLDEQVVYLLDVLVQEVGVLHESLKLSNTIKKTTGNLASHLSMNIMNGEVDCVSNKLQPLSSVLHLLQFLNVDFREANLLNRRLGLLWLRHWLPYISNWRLRSGLEASLIRNRLRWVHTTMHLIWHAT